jgi:probable lipoprotein LpqN
MRIASAVAAVVILGALAGCSLDVSGSARADPAASAPTPTPSPSPPPPTVAPGFVDPQGRFGITAPSGWQADTSGKSGTEVIFSSPKADTTDAGELPANINVVVVPGGADLEQTIEASRKSLKTLPNYEEITDTPVVLDDGTPAHLLGGTFTRSGLALQNLQLFTSAGGTDMVVTGTALEKTWDKWEGLFDQTFQTFTVHPPS